MSSSISAGLTTGTAIAFSGDTSGALVLQTNGTTTAVTLDTSQNATFAGKVTSAGALTLASNGTTTAVTKDTSQNVGIGGAPAYKLDITSSAFIGSRLTAATGTNGVSQIYTNTGGAFSIGIDASTGANFGAAYGGFLWHAGAYPLLFGTSNAERMRIDSSGNLLVNSATSPSGSGNAFFNGNVYVGSTNTDPTFNRVNGLLITTNGCINTRANTTWDLGRDVTSGSHITFYTDNGSARVTAGNISSNGGTTSYNTTSDYRMKENIAPMAGALTIIQALKPITYDWKEEFVGTKKSSQGFIAHELAEVVPDCVTGEKDAVDDEGKPKYQGIDTSFLVATLTAAIQEAHALIIQLQADVAALKGVK